MEPLVTLTNLEVLFIFTLSSSTIFFTDPFHFVFVLSSLWDSSSCLSLVYLSFLSLALSP